MKICIYLLDYCKIQFLLISIHILLYIKQHKSFKYNYNIKKVNKNLHKTITYMI